MHNNLDDNISKNAKIFFLIVLIGILFFIYAYRLFVMQIVNGEHYRDQSERISSQVTVLSAQRGEIFDRNANLPMVINTDSFCC